MSDVIRLRETCETSSLLELYKEHLPAPKSLGGKWRGACRAPLPDMLRVCIYPCGDRDLRQACHSKSQCIRGVNASNPKAHINSFL